MILPPQDDAPDSFDRESADDQNTDDLALEYAAVRRLIKLLGRLQWFSRIGLPLEAADEDNARAYIDYLGFPEMDIVGLETLDDAQDAGDTLDMNSPAWEAEEQLRAALSVEAATYIDEEELNQILQHINSIAAESATEALELAAARMGPMPEDLAHSAVGAAVKAAHLAALLLLADDDADHHAFAYYFKLFELGRWPIATTGNSFFLL